jgi:hypothetical protein
MRDRLPECDEPLSQLQLWKYSRDCAPEAGRNTRCRFLRVEPTWTQIEEGEKGIRILAPIVGVRCKKDEEAEKDIARQNASSSILAPACETTSV